MQRILVLFILFLLGTVDSTLAFSETCNIHLFNTYVVVSSYVGDCRDGLAHGQGRVEVEYTDDGQRFRAVMEGTFERGFQEGRGVFSKNEGYVRRFEGIFKRGRPWDGIYTVSNSDGSVTRTIAKEGKQVSIQRPSIYSEQKDRQVQWEKAQMEQQAKIQQEVLAQEARNKSEIQKEQERLAQVNAQTQRQQQEKDQKPSTVTAAATSSGDLIQALKGKDENGALILIGGGADVNVTDEEYGASALHWAILNGYKLISGLLIEKGANINARTKNGATPVYAAASSGRREILELLIARGADLNAKDEQGVSPLKVAASNGYKAVVELLKAKGAKF